MVEVFKKFFVLEKRYGFERKILHKARNLLFTPRLYVFTARKCLFTPGLCKCKARKLL